eukprot:GHRR01000473.1.p2 GENE.GHRR01000473.1~~GHRR01000473.1.p2  ORF type:complete len:470 (+),score=208.18 GHRR01000473.1:347-1756(+)
MGLASKLQAAQGGGAMMAPPMGGAPIGAAAPYGAPGAPSAPPAPYPSPYPGQTGQPGAPNPYGPPPQGSNNPFGGPPGAMPGQQQQQQAPYGQQQPAPYAQQGTPAPYPSPYPGAAPGGPVAGPYPGSTMPPQQQQRPPYPAPGMPGAPGIPQQQPAPYGQHQPAPYGQQPGATAAPGATAGAPVGAPGGMAGSILTKLQTIVNVNQLHRFYSPPALQALAQKLDSRVNFRDLAARWRMPVELALDLSALALYDIIMFADDSGSMAFEENGERIEDLKLISSKVAEIATMFDDDGILMRFMNSPTEGNGIRSPTDVAQLLASVQYTGLTPIATALQQKVLQPIVYHLASTGQLQKPVLIISITDGEPTDNPRDLVVQVIKDARNRLAPQYGPKAIAFEFAQVGKDQRAQAFLGRLDTDPEVGSSIDCTSYFELEAAEYQKKGIQLSPEAWLVKMMVGGIDPSSDKGDEL